MGRPDAQIGSPFPSPEQIHHERGVDFHLQNGLLTVVLDDPPQRVLACLSAQVGRATKALNTPNAELEVGPHVTMYPTHLTLYCVALLPPTSMYSNTKFRVFASIHVLFMPMSFASLAGWD